MTGDPIYLLSICARSAAALMLHLAGVVLVAAARANGETTRSIAWAWWVAVLVPMDWYIAASLMHWSGCCPAFLPTMWRWSWLVWAPSAGVGASLVWSFRHVLAEMVRHVLAEMAWLVRQAIPWRRR